MEWHGNKTDMKTYGSMLPTTWRDNWYVYDAQDQPVFHNGTKTYPALSYISQVKKNPSCYVAAT